MPAKEAGSRLQPASRKGLRMSSHVFHEILIHLNRHTKHDQPLLRGRTEELAHRALRDKASRMKGVSILELGGTDDHVHLAVQIEPYATISELVQELKGASAFEVNQALRHKALEWQRGYGVVSFGRRHLPWVVEYIRRQREHHAHGTIHVRLEAHEPDERPPAVNTPSASPAEAG